MSDTKIPRHEVTIDNDPETPNYMTGILKAINEGILDLDALKGKCMAVNVYHDDWCAICKGGECNCNCEIQARPMFAEEE